MSDQSDPFKQTREAGAAPYFPTLPYTQVPVSSQWDINAHMMQLLRRRHAA